MPLQTTYFTQTALICAIVLLTTHATMSVFRPSEYDINHQYVTISSYIAMVILVLGLLGNMFGMKMMLNRELKEYSCTVFLAALAISDTIVLIYDVIDDIAVHIESKTGYDIIYNGNHWRCRFGVFFYECSRLVSSWLVVALAAELCLVAVDSNLHSMVYTRKRAMYVTLAIGLIAIAGCFPFLVISSEKGNVGRCISKYQVFFEVYMMFVLRVAAQGIVPFLLLIGCCFAATYSLRHQFQFKDDSDNKPLVKVKCQAKVMILAMSVTFILTLCPSTIVDLGFALQRYTHKVTLTYPDWDQAWYITHTISLLNYSFKFFIIVSSWPECRASLGGTGLRLGLRNTLSGAYNEVQAKKQPKKTARKRFSIDENVL